MTYKIRVEYTNCHDTSIDTWNNWDEYYESNIHPSYFKEFNTKEEMACFILDLADREDMEIIVKPMDSGVFGSKDKDYREVEVYNDYRE